jgi:hypothetical protein
MLRSFAATVRYTVQVINHFSTLFSTFNRKELKVAAQNLCRANAEVCSDCEVRFLH